MGNSSPKSSGPSVSPSSSQESGNFVAPLSDHQEELSRYLLQNLMQKGSILQAQAEAFILKAAQSFKIKDIPNLVSIVSHANSKLAPLNFEVRQSISEADGKIYVSLINTMADDVSQSFSAFDPKEVKIFTALLNAIIDSGKGYVYEEQVMNLYQNVSLTKHEFKSLLNDLLLQQWFQRNDSLIHMGPRTLLEFGAYLRDVAADKPGAIGFCYVCDSSCAFGMKCGKSGTSACEQVRVHRHCAKNFYRAVSANDSEWICKRCNDSCLVVE